MKRTLFLTMLVTALSCVALAQTTGGKTNPSSVEQAIKRLDNERIQAIQKGDTAFIQRVYADDYVVTGSNGRVRNKAQVIADFKSGVLKVQSMKDDELKVRVYGDTAILTGRSAQTVDDRGQVSSGQVLFTRVCEAKWSMAVRVSPHVECDPVSAGLIETKAIRGACRVIRWPWALANLLSIF